MKKNPPVKSIMLRHDTFETLIEENQNLLNILESTINVWSRFLFFTFRKPEEFENFSIGFEGLYFQNFLVETGYHGTRTIIFKIYVQRVEEEFLKFEVTSNQSQNH